MKQTNKQGMDRRQFLQTTGMTAAGVAAVGAGVTLVGAGDALAMTTEALSEHQAKTLLGMARHLFPHDFLGDQYYAKAVMALDAQAKGDDKVKKTIADGVAALDAHFGLKWVDLSEGYQHQALNKAADSDFFATVRGTTLNTIYGDPLVWRYFGYEGSSVEFGGYIERGFDDIGWLPKT